MDEEFVLGGQWVPSHACREHLDIVSKKIAHLYGCSDLTAMGMLLLKLSSVIAKEECPFHRCERGQSFSVRIQTVNS